LLLPARLHTDLGISRCATHGQILDARPGRWSAFDSAASLAASTSLL
jgi:hypothetical protein